MKYLLDTDVSIHILKRADKTLIKRVMHLPTSDFGTCSIVKAELLAGARKSQRVSENLALLQEFFGLLRSIPFDDEAAEQYGLLRAVLERAGAPIGPNDLLIASIASSHKLTLITRNRSEFRRIPGLAMEVW
ncbi:MAG: type II toxin-antitoxin system VapC family toxin [Deltaproteobacteria bacterium]|nr:type II toxin-antitoxin system VapC family toxin [Deltaproteobacteria bacterium]MBI3293169.1 type II toxin-antitoxin system VapC family toxin [Deltaproteobacteria bacterium]